MAQDFVEDFSNIIIIISKILSKTISSDKFEIIDRGIPHIPPTVLPRGKTAVYTFYCPSEKCFLKIGKAVFKSQARFTSQHYNYKSANSNLAKSLLNDKKNEATI